MLDKAALQHNKERWKEVAKFELKEEQQSTALDRWKTLNALLKMAFYLNLNLDTNVQEKEIIWHRWNKLREIHISNANT